MSDYDNAIFRLATAQETEPEDYTVERQILVATNSTFFYPLKPK